LHVTGNKPIGATEILASCTAALERALPRRWRVAAGSPPRPAASRVDGARWTPDAVLRVRGPDGRTARLAVAVRRRLEPNDAWVLLERAAAARGPGEVPGCSFVAAEYLGPRTRTLLADRGVGYADATGNLRLALDRPALFLQAVGADRDPVPDSRPVRSLRGASAGRAVRAILDFPPPFGVRELAVRSGVSSATLSRVIELLVRAAILRRESPRGPVTSVDWQAVLRRWTEDYSLVGSNRTAACLEPRGLDALWTKLQGAGLDYALTASAVAAQVAPVASPRLAVLYVVDLGVAAGRLELRPAETGGNVMLVEPFDRVVFERTVRRGGLVHAALTQVVADLLTSPGRGPSEAEALIRWMAANESTWHA
jgi:hypothetical protein